MFGDVANDGDDCPSLAIVYSPAPQFDPTLGSIFTRSQHFHRLGPSSSSDHRIVYALELLAGEPLDRRGSKREDLLACLAQHGAGRGVDVDEPHARAVGQVDRFCRGIHRMPEAQQTQFAPFALGDVGGNPTITLECARAVEHGVAAHRKMMFGTVRANARELENAERQVRLERLPMRLPTRLVRRKGWCFPAALANDGVPCLAYIGILIPGPLHDAMLGVGLPVEVGGHLGQVAKARFALLESGFVLCQFLEHRICTQDVAQAPSQHRPRHGFGDEISRPGLIGAVDRGRVIQYCQHDNGGAFPRR